jgi:DNA excision repair protein ERCC-2
MSKSKEENPTWKNFFPYEIRPAQTTMVNFISKLIPKGYHMVLEAANGTGKTIATLASILPFAMKKQKKVIYMARTHSQIDRVMEELAEISQFQKVSGIALRGRQSMCLNKLVLKHAKDARSASEMCQQLKATKKCTFYNNMLIESRTDSVVSLLKSKPATAEVIFELSESAEICPAETARLMLKYVNVVACHYLYILDENIRKSFLEQMEVDFDDLILIFDEAHNLPDTVIDTASDELSTFALNRAIREASNEKRVDFHPFLEAAQEYLTEVTVKAKIGDETLIDPGVLLEELELESNIDLDDDFFYDMIEAANKIRWKLAKQGKDPRSSLGRVGEFFLHWYESLGKKEYTHTIEKQTLGDFKNAYSVLRVTSLDPGKTLLPILKQVFSSVHISGTIGEAQAYCHLTGLDNLSVKINILPSPYDPKNIKVLITDKISTLYNHRSSENYMKMVDIISEVIRNTPGNIGIFAPSYSILNELVKSGLEEKSVKPLFIISSDMNSSENDVVITKFKKQLNIGGGVLCSVLGGRSSEGTDFKGDLMLSVIVVGMPFAPPSPRIQAKINYLENQFPGNGRTLGYIIPAVNKASQGAGRAVRTLDDRAFILLMDFRYNNTKNRMILPMWMKGNITTIEPESNKIEQEVRNFFSDRYGKLG